METRRRTAGKLLAYGLLGGLLLGTFSSVMAQNRKAEGPPKATRGPADTFTGTVWVTSLVANDSTYTTVAGSVVFEPGARSYWHSHPAGQLLLVTDGVGYHQLKGESIQVIRKGDVVKCPPNVTHWHGASAGSSMTHLYILPNTEKGIVNWLQAVTDEEYKATR